MKQESPTSKPQAKTIKPIFIIAPIAIALIGFLIFRSAYKQYQDGLTVSGTVQASEVQFGSRQSGRVSEVLAKEGQVLKKGDVIVLLEAKELENQKEELNKKLHTETGVEELIQLASDLEKVTCILDEKELRYLELIS